MTYQNSSSFNIELIVYQTLDSTNDEGKRLIQSGYNKEAVILAYNQTKGRGRENRQWMTKKGNLQCTIILPNLALSPTKQTFLCFVTAIAVYDTINKFRALKYYNKYIKWPNDIIIDGKKISGILLESINQNDTQNLLIGIGINIKHNPEDIKKPTTSLSKLGIKNLTPKKLLTKLIILFAKYYDLWQVNGKEYIIKEWLKRSYPIGTSLTFNYQNNLIDCIFKGIKDNGDIIIQHNGELLSFTIGEIFNI